MNSVLLEKEYLTIGDIGRYLNISQSNAYALSHRKDFPVCHFGGSIRVPRGAFLAWVDQNTHTPKSLVVA